MKHLIKYIVVILLFLVIGLVFFLNKSKDPSNLRTIKVAQYDDVFIYAPLYLADIKGYYEEEGLKVELITTGGDDNTFSAVMGGSAVFGIADPAFVAIAREKYKFKGKVIGSIVNSVPFSALTFKDVPQITDSRMLQPYSVATFSSPSTAYAVQTNMFKEAGLKPNIIEGTPGTILPMLSSNSADIGLELEPEVSTAINRGAKVVYTFTDKYPEFTFTGITTSVKTIESDPELVQHFINAITKAEEYAHMYPDSAAFYLQNKFRRFDGKIIEDAIKRMVDSNTLPRNAIISDEAWETALKMRFEIGDLTSMENTDTLLDMSFAKRSIR